MAQQSAILARVATLSAREIAALPVADKIAVGRALAALAATERAEWIQEMTRVPDPTIPGYYRHDWSRLSALDYAVGESSPPRPDAAEPVQKPSPIQIRVKFPDGKLYAPDRAASDRSPDAKIIGTCEFCLDVGSYYGHSDERIAAAIAAPPRLKIARGASLYEISDAQVRGEKILLNATLPPFEIMNA